jgi:hypothetical protein
VKNDFAIVRQHIQRIEGVSRTWFEWAWDHSVETLTKTLVVEVAFDTDPNASGFRQYVLDAIVETAAEVLKNETAMVVSDLKIVPQKVG